MPRQQHQRFTQTTLQWTRRPWGARAGTERTTPAASRRLDPETRHWRRKPGSARPRKRVVHARQESVHGMQESGAREGGHGRARAGEPKRLGPYGNTGGGRQGRACVRRAGAGSGCAGNGRRAGAGARARARAGAGARARARARVCRNSNDTQGDLGDVTTTQTPPLRGRHYSESCWPLTPQPQQRPQCAETALVFGAGRSRGDTRA